MGKLSTIEREYQFLLPSIYKDFYNLCALSLPDNLVGTDLINNCPYIDLRNGARELLEEGGVNNFLNSDDFVFMMHQGYMFWYFRANGDPDPFVFGYYEGKLKPDNFGVFSEFIKEHTK